jgi:pantoate--beta-alanine ligase
MTKIISSIAEWKKLKKQFAHDISIGFVPTMGHLHQGHLSLCKRSGSDNQLTVVSIYVNPTQFNQAQDLQNYPRTLEQDIDLLKATGKVDYCLVLDDSEIYADDYLYRMSEQSLSLRMEGEFRPGHFTGMLSVVLKLLCGVAPNKAYFGEKDYQQYLLIKGMQEAYFLDCDIIVCPTIREASGLACSSRNSRLSSAEKVLAEQFACIFLQKDKSIEQIQVELNALEIKMDYCVEYAGRRFIAAFIGSIRLIDNYAMDNKGR